MTRSDLERYRKLKLEVKQTKALIDELNASIYHPSAIKMDGMPHSSGFAGSALESAVLRKTELEEKYQLTIRQMQEEMLRIEQAIQVLPATEKLVITYRYIRCMRWEDICDEMCYSWKQTHRIHRRALDMLESVQFDMT